MATVTITTQDRLDAETYLESLLTSKIIDGDFSRGSFLRDLVITSIAYTVAYLRAEASVAVQRSSVKTVLTMAPGADRDDAADDVMSNWFLTRRSGRPSRGPILIHLSTDADLVIPKTTRFFYNASMAYVPDYSEDVAIPKESIIHVTDATNVITDRYVTLNVVSTATGAAYDVDPATWLTFDPFSAFVTRVENLAAFTGGKETETTDEFLARATDAVTVRDLNSPRAIRATLLDKYPVLDDVVVVGAGDPEMQRDLASGLGALDTIHTAGFTDVYLRSPVAVSQIYEAAVGGAFQYPSPEIVVFTDSTIPNLSALAHTRMMLRVYNALSGEPTLFVIAAATPKFLLVSPRNPFPELRTGVEYSVGGSAPDYTDAVALRATGEYSRDVIVPGAVLLPAVPVYNIRSVSYIPLGGGARVYLTRENSSGGVFGGVTSGRYQVVYTDPKLAHTAYQAALLLVNNIDIPDTTVLRVEYDTPSGFSDVHSYMLDAFNRVACASVIPRGQHPVYVSFNVSYTLKSTATSVLDEAAAKKALADYINSYTSADTLNVSDVITFLQSTYSQIGSVVPFSISYSLLSPTGNVIPYTTTDAVRVDPAYEVSSPPVLTSPQSYGISTRTSRVLTTEDMITLTEV